MFGGNIYIVLLTMNVKLCILLLGSRYWKSRPTVSMLSVVLDFCYIKHVLVYYYKPQDKCINVTKSLAA